MATNDHYDVIIVGTGAGGGTLAHTVAASGQAGAAARARRLPAPRDARTGAPSRCSSTAGTSRRRPGTTPTARRSSRRSTTSSAAPPSSTARRCTACARRTSARSSTSTASRRRGRSPTTTSSPGTRRPSGSTRCTATTARTRPRVPGRSSTRGRRCPTSRASRRSPTTLTAAGYHPFSAPCGILLDEARPRPQRLHPLHVVRRLPVPRARQVRRRDDRRAPAARRPERHAARRRRGAPARDRRHRSHRHRRGRVARRAPRRSYAADIVVVSAGASNSAKLLLRSANDAHPNGLANGSDQVGRNYMFHNSKAVVALAKERNDTVFQKTLGINDFYLDDGSDGGWPARQHPDGRQVQRLRDEGRGAEADQARPALEPRRRRRTTPSTSG